MKFNKTLSVLALAVAGAMAAPAQAFMITTADGTKSFTGFDWDSSGTAYTDAPFNTVSGSPLTLTYYGWATAVKNGIFNVNLPNLDTSADGVNDGYEFTVVARLSETVDTCTTPSSGGTTCSFTVLGGIFDIYYDTTANANATTGTGFEDGVKIISGTFGLQSGGSFHADTPGNGKGDDTLIASVTYTNLSYISQTLFSSRIGTTLQQGTFQTDGNYPRTGAPDGSGGIVLLPVSGGDIFQADANQSFAVPEPDSLALVAGGLLLGAGSLRRRSKKR